MLRIKSFGAFGALYDNRRDVINPIGELSAYAETFGSDRQTYKAASQYPNGSLVIFNSVREISSTESEIVEVPEVVRLLALRIMEDLFNLSVTGQLVDDRDMLLQYLQSNYEGSIQAIDFGNIISDTRNYLPEYLYYEGTSASSPYAIRIWLADGAFRRQYDLYEHRVAEVYKNVDDFFGTGAEVQALVDAVDTRVVLLEVDAVARRQPPTTSVTEYFDWVNPANSAQKIPVPFTVVIYGEAGKNLDALKKTLADYLLANSKGGYTEEQWGKIFPDIFGATEFIFAPVWSHVAAPGDVLNRALYYPGNNPNFALTFLKALAQGKGYTEAHVGSKWNLVASTFNGVQLAVIGGPTNRDGVVQFADWWKDYIAVTTQSIDFDRMSDNTKAMVKALHTLLLTAETMTNQTDIPTGTMRAIRNGVLYITASVERCQLLVVAKQSALEKFPIFQGSGS